MKKNVELVLVALAAQVFNGVLAAEPSTANQSKALKPLTADNFNARAPETKRQAPGVREHMNLRPVTAEEFKAGPTTSNKPGPGIRGHLNLKPVTADEFKHAASAPRQ